MSNLAGGILSELPFLGNDTLSICLSDQIPLIIP